MVLLRCNWHKFLLGERQRVLSCRLGFGGCHVFHRCWRYDKLPVRLWICDWVRSCWVRVHQCCWLHGSYVATSDLLYLFMDFKTFTDLLVGQWRNICCSCLRCYSLVWLHHGQLCDNFLAHVRFSLTWVPIPYRLCHLGSHCRSKLLPSCFLSLPSTHRYGLFLLLFALFRTHLLLFCLLLLFVCNLL